jgi:ATP-binding cassette subfamily B (MDR/TAP) protein 1
LVGFEEVHLLGHRHAALGVADDHLLAHQRITPGHKTYFATLLKQEIGWFDCINQSELSSTFTSDTQTFQGAIGEKVAIMLQVSGTFLGGFIISFMQGWLMTLVCLAVFPIIAYAGFLYMRALQNKSS